MRLLLALPDLLVQGDAALSAAPSLQRLAFYADTPALRRGGLDRPLINAATGREDSPIAPLAALGAGLDAGGSYVLRADPVSLIAGRADVSLERRIDDLDADECRGLLATLNGHFGVDGIAFHAPRPDAWFITADVPPSLTTTPLDDVRGPIYPYLPGGDDAPKWRRWLSEMQMLLHEHPANLARQNRGSTPVTGIWVSEGGRAADMPASPAATMFAPSGSVGDVARGMARARGDAVGEPPMGFAGLPKVESVIAVLSPLREEDVSPIDRQWLKPALAALEDGSLSALTLVADGNGESAAWRPQRPGWSRRIRARLSSHRFAPPRIESET
jgi:hypothetical protein